MNSPVQPPVFRVGKKDLFLRPGQADIAEAALLFEPVGVGQGALVRKQSVFQSTQKYEWEFQSLRRVQCHELDAVLVGFRLCVPRFQYGEGKELGQRR